jgi:hypothetical protein
MKLYLLGVLIVAFSFVLLHDPFLCYVLSNTIMLFHYPPVEI